MSKSFRRLATIVGVAALAATGIGVLAIPGVTLGTTFVLGSASITLGMLGTFGALALSIGAMPGKPIEETGANDRGTAFVDPDAVGCYVFGTTTVQCTLVYEEVTGASPDRLVHDVFAHAWHRINAYVSLTIGADDGPETVTFSGNAATGTHANMLWWFRALGNQVAALSGAPFDDNAWPTTAIFTGVAHSGIVWNVDDDAFKEKFASVPTKLDVVVEAAMLYDPRLDPAYGSGSQDFGTPSGWTFNNGNAILVLLRALIGERTAGGKLIWGRGALETEIDMASFVAMANVADETLDSKPRFRLGGFQALGPGHWEEFVQRWEQETGGKLSKSGGVYRVWLPHDDLTPLTTITEADLLAEHPVTHPVAAGVEGLFNTARGRYIESTQGYRAFGYPDVVESSAVTDDGGERMLYHDFSWVQDVSIAQRIARIKVRRSRFQRVWTISLGWKGFGPNYRPFTVHTLNIKETGNNNEIVRVIHRDLDVMTGVAVLTLQQEDASIYDDSLALGTPFASNTIPNRISRESTITPRYIQGTAVGWVADSAGKPAGLRQALSGSNTPNRSTLSIVDGVAHIAAGTTEQLGYALPAIPIDDALSYQLKIKYRGTVASADGFYLRFYESTAALPGGKTHVGNDDPPAGEAVVEPYDTFVGLLADAALITTWAEQTFTYTPTSGTLFASLEFDLVSPATATALQIAWVSLTTVDRNIDLLPGVRPPGDFPDLVPSAATRTVTLYDATETVVIATSAPTTGTTILRYATLQVGESSDVVQVSCEAFVEAVMLSGATGSLSIYAGAILDDLTGSTFKSHTRILDVSGTTPDSEQCTLFGEWTTLPPGIYRVGIFADWTRTAEGVGSGNQITVDLDQIFIDGTAVRR